MRAHRFASFLFITLLGLAGVTRAEDAPKPNKGGPPEFKFIKYRSIGPAAGGRVCRACGVPGDPHTYYAATAAGGVWKSSDGGLTWKPIFDEQPVSSIGSIAVAPSDPNVIYVGSGEANVRGNVEPGNGIYKSSDAGKTWKLVWKQEGQIGTMIVHPTNPDVAFAAVLGHAFGPNEERGVYRTTDGGKNWQRVLYKDKETGASDVCFDPSNPRVLFAGLWQVRRQPWDMTSGGPGSGLYVSRDGGDTWTRLVAPPKPESPDAAKEPATGTKRCPGLPEGIWGKIGLAVAPSDHNRVYAMIEAEKGGLFRSDDGGDTWSLANDARVLRQRAWYYSTLSVHPKNPDVVYFPQVPLMRTIDGGKTLERVKGTHHGDHHDVWIDPKDPQRMINSNDGGVDLTTNGGETWYAPPLPISQFYHVNADNQTPYHVSGCMQDLGTASGPSNSLSRGGISLTDWIPVGGGETGFTAPDPSDPNVIYAGEYGGYVSRFDRRTRQAKNVGVYPFNPSGHGAEDLKYRFQWTAPILISPHDPKTIYHAANVLFKSRDGGQTWQPMGGDLTRNDKSKQKWAGGPITGDNTGVEVYGTIFAIAESPKEKGLLWAGSDDGLVHLSRDGGKSWENVTAAIKGLPEWGTVCCIEASPHDAGTAYVVVDAHKLDNMKPYLFKTTDYGKTWDQLANGLDRDVFLRAVREDPKQRDLLYLGTERGVSYSTDGGASWKPLKLNLPTVAVTDLVVKGDDLVVGTNGRSLWILDDLTPIRAMGQDVTAKAVHFFPAQPAFRYRYGQTIEERPRRGSASNPPEGAILHYYLKERPKGDVVLEIVDAKGATVRRLDSKKEQEDKEIDGDYPIEKLKKKVLPADPGLHRVAWDLRYEGAKVIKGAKADSGEPRIGPLVDPGTYTLKLTVEGKTLTVPLQVRLDPRQLAAFAPEPVRPTANGSGSGRTDKEVLGKELEEQLKLTLDVRDSISRLSQTVEQMRAVKRQLEARNELLKDDAKAEALVKASKEFVAKLDALEEKLHNPKAKVAYDVLAQKGGAKLYSQLVWLFEQLKDADGPPTQGVKEQYQEQAELLRKYEEEWKTLQSGDLAKLNDAAKKLDLPGVIVPAIK
jgi:photosystem II stability/assembly factor-like uncharacterized protein